MPAATTGERPAAPDGATSRARLGSVVRVFGPLGWRAIGGPAAHVALMEREVVRRRGWLDRGEFGRLFAACNLLPGPGSTQLALLLGLRRAGAAGMAAAAVLFIGPAVLLMLALGELYLHIGSDHRSTEFLLGVEAVVVAIVARAALDLAVLTSRGVRSVSLAVMGLVTGVVHLDPLISLAAGAAAGFGAHQLGAARRREGTSGAARAVLPAVLSSTPTGGSGLLLPLALTFLKIGVVAFGSGYVLLPFLHANLVGGQFGLDEHQVADAFAVSQATPGPVFGLAAFLGVQIAGIWGGVVAAAAIFAPSLVLVPLVGAVVRLLERVPAARAALDGVMATALGLIASACVDLARVAFVGPLEVAAALMAFAYLWRRPTGQPVALAVGLIAGAAIALTSP